MDYVQQDCEGELILSSLFIGPNLSKIAQIEGL
jgi:hypothetical protein